MIKSLTRNCFCSLHKGGHAKKIKQLYPPDPKTDKGSLKNYNFPRTPVMCKCANGENQK